MVTPPPPRPVATAVRAGNFQSARQRLPFAAQLTVAVTDAVGGPVPGVWVTFRVTSGSAGFSAGARVASAASNASGIATAPVLDAGSVVGAVRVTALATGTSRPATYTLRVIPY